MEPGILTEAQGKAAALAAIAWRYRDSETWRGLKVWEQFTDRLRLCATTNSSLARAWTALAASLGVESPHRPEDREALADIIGGGEDRVILRILRQETELIALAVRLDNEERKEAWKAKQASAATEPTQQEALL